MKKIEIEEVKDHFPQKLRLPEWASIHDVLIRSRRTKNYFIVKGIALGQRWVIKGFEKFKVIGWK